MPISPEKDRLYPGGSIRSPEWQSIRKRILQRSLAYDEFFDMYLQRCECEGQCGICHKKENEEIHIDDEYKNSSRCDSINGNLHSITESKIVLTIAHIDQNPKNSEDENLLALCQRCHNRMDASHRAKNSQQTRRKKMAIGDLFDGD